MSKYTPKPAPQRNGKPPSEFVRYMRRMTSRPSPAKPVPDEPPADTDESDEEASGIQIPGRYDLWLSDAHAEQMNESGITAAHALSEGVHTETDPAKLAKLLNWKSVPPERGSGLVFPVHDANGNVSSVQVKFDHPRPDPDKPGKVVKYEQRRGCSPAPYIPRMAREVLYKPHKSRRNGWPPIITEGLKKALCGESHSFPCIALPGVTMWGKGGKLVPALDEVVWEGRAVFIVFDSDAATNPNVRLQEQKLAAVLTERGAVVTVVRLPGKKGKKVGLDDYIVAHGPDALRQLMADAHRTQHTTGQQDDGEPLGDGPTGQQEPNESEPLSCCVLGEGQPPPPFPVDVLPGPLAEFVRATTAAKSYPVDFLAVLMLAVLGTMIGRKRRVQVRADWCEYAVIWAVIVGRSGEGKSPAYQVATAPLRHLQKRLMEELEGEVEAWQNLPAEERAETPKPKLVQVMTTDATLEGLKGALANSPGVCFAVDELAGWVKAQNQYKRGGDDRQQLLSMWSSSTVVSTRAGRDPIVIPDPFLCVCGGTQPDVLGVLIGDATEDGLAPRFLVSYPDPLPPPDWTDDVVAGGDGYQRVCDALWEMEATDDPILLSPQAKGVWAKWFNAHQQDQPPDVLRPVWSKCKGYVLRLALVLFLSRKAAGETDAEELDAESMAGAVELVRYFQAHARRVYGTAAKKDGGRIHRALEWIHKRGGQVTAREVQMNSVAGCRPTVAEDAKQLLHDLKDLGHGTTTAEARGSLVFRTNELLLRHNAQQGNETEGGAE